MNITENCLTQIDLPLKRLSSGKVREIFELSGNRLLIVTSDRISAYDVVMEQGIPQKGSILTMLSLFWLDLYSDLCPNHLVEPAELPEEINQSPDAAELIPRSMVVRKLDMLPLEFVIRGYLVGSGWKDYRATGAVCGVGLPKGLSEGEKLPEAIFTPATKATTGHDENISEDQAMGLVDPSHLKTARDFALELYSRAAAYAEQRGIILADTKFEFGLEDGQVVLADEVLTPDSSRFWPADEYSPGSVPRSFDKQYLRDWLDSIGWDRNPPPPQLPEEVVATTAARYREAYSRLTGVPLE